jgi:hypothetical protein
MFFGHDAGCECQISQDQSETNIEDRCCRPVSTSRPSTVAVRTFPAVADFRGRAMKFSLSSILRGIRTSLAGMSFLFLLLPLTAGAQTYIFGRANLPVGTGPTSIATGDFNGDGTLDVAVVNEADNTVSIVLGEADGSFAPQVTYATGLGPLAIVAGDFDGDGNLDLAITNGDCSLVKGGGVSCGRSTLSILLGNGDGTFRTHIDYAAGGTQPSAAVAADFNGDGKLDLAVTSAQDGTVSVLLGNGDGTFQEAFYPTVSGAQSVIVADFNGDHKLDLAVGGNGVSILLGNGDGTFQKQLAAPGGSPLAAADFNGDGKLDLFADGSILLGRGDGTFALYAAYPFAAAAVAADLNGDGKPDVVVAQGDPKDNLSTYSVSVLLGNGDGTFQTAVRYGTAADPPFLVIADFNGDGKFDLAVADPDCAPFSCSTPGAVSILLGLGDGTFVGGKDYAFQAPPSEVISADFNGDGKPDIAAEEAFSGGAPLGVFLGNGDGSFQPEVFTALAQSAGGIAAGDFNGDGKADLASVVFSSCSNTCLPGHALVLIGNGDGTFQSPVEYAVGLDPRYLAVGDFNGDGKPDLAVSNFRGNTVSILLGNGDGTFKPHVDYPAGTQPESIATGDFKGDGVLDLAVVNVSNTVLILLGNGDGTFTSGTPLTTISQPQGVVTADFNGDGKLDLAVTTITPDEVFIFLGNGDGTFQTSAGYSDGIAFGLPSVGDFNGDGKPDLVVGGAYAYVAAILLGNGDGSFQQPIFNFLEQGQIAVADFNQDGSPDVAGGSTTSSAVAVMLSSSFKAVSPAAFNFGSQGVGTTSAPQTITISNPSNVKFNISSIVASGNFSQSNDCGASLVPGAHCDVAAKFTPTATGLESGAITVTDSTKISPLAIPLSGTGVNGPFLTPYPSRVNFAPQTVGTNSAPAPVVLVNTGNASMHISGISVTGAESSDFTQINNCGSSLPAAGMCTVNVTFTPKVAGSRVASIAVSDTAPGSPQSVSLVGAGLGPIANLNPRSLTFASQNVGTTSPPQIVTLTNTGTSTLNLTGIAALGDFSQTNTCNTSLAVGGNCQISVTFAPTATGSRAGTVTIADNASNSPQTVGLSGTGTTAPDFTIGPASGSSSSSTITAGKSATFNLTVAPVGSFSGTVNLTCSITPAETPAPTCSLPGSVNLTGGMATPVMVTVATTAPATAGTMSSANFPPGARLVTWTLALFASYLLFIGKPRRRPVLSSSIIVLAFIAVAGCGSGGSSSHSTPGTPVGTYTATVKATSGSLSHSTILKVVVQ